MISVVFLIIGLFAAIFGANLLVSGSSSIARKYNVSPLIIGAVIVGFGTSMPEFAVNISSALKGHTSLAITNILGSNIFNIFLILGIAGLVHPVSISSFTRKKNLPFYLIAAILVGVCGNEILIDGFSISELTRSTGIVFLFFFIIYMYYTFTAHLKNNDKPKKETKSLSLFKSVFYIIIGLAGLIFGGEFIVKGAVGIAESLGISHSLIGLLLVGPGTSFPELIATIVAIKKKEYGLGIGNVIGSNIFNIFFILGITAIIKPLPLAFELNISVLVNIFAALLLLIYAFTGKKSIGRFKAISFLTLYTGYVIYLVISG